MSKLETLLDQTTFLLEKQKEAKRDCLALFSDLLSAVEKRLSSIKNSQESKEEHEALTGIKELVSEQSEQISHDAQEDIDFLTDQLKALQEIKNVKDPVKAKGLLDMLLDEETEIKDTVVFKKEVSEEAALSRQNLVVMLNDLKEAIQEGNAEEVAQYLESVLGGGQEGEECCQDDDECCGGNGSCSKSKSAKGSCQGCTECDSDEVDIFESLGIYHEEETVGNKDKKKK